MKKCPWCGQESDTLVMVMYFTKHYSYTEKVCPACRKAWLKKLKKSIGGGK